ncbi:MAG: hypothetical protein WA854_09375 [Candidatus Binataceae bacterium]
MTATKEKHDLISGLVAEILATTPEHGRAKIAAWRNPMKDLTRLARRDYVRSLRKSLSFRDLRQVVSNAATVWPTLNQKQLRTITQGQFTRTARKMTDNLQVHFQASPYVGPEGMALRGFYVDRRRRMLKRPIIYVNTAHQPGAVSSTFCHELGHHLTSRLFGAHHKGVHFFFDADYAGHLDDPIELAADVLVSLAGYPEESARRMFPVPWDWGLVARTGKLSGKVFGKVRAHAEAYFGIDFG